MFQKGVCGGWGLSLINMFTFSNIEQEIGVTCAWDTTHNQLCRATWSKVGNRQIAAGFTLVQRLKQCHAKGVKWQSGPSEYIPGEIWDLVNSVSYVFFQVENCTHRQQSLPFMTLANSSPLRGDWCMINFSSVNWIIHSHHSFRGQPTNHDNYMYLHTTPDDLTYHMQCSFGNSIYRLYVM